MIRITEEMRRLINNALEDGFPCILGTASPQGEPNITYRGSMMVFDNDSLAYWDRTRRATPEHVEANPQVVVVYRNTKERKAWKFHGTAAAYRDGPIRLQVMARVVPQELESDPGRKGIAVVIKLDRIMTLGGQVVQNRD